jgi:hypothetical protein
MMDTRFGLEIWGVVVWVFGLPEKAAQAAAHMHPITVETNGVFFMSLTSSYSAPAHGSSD